MKNTILCLISIFFVGLNVGVISFSLDGKIMNGEQVSQVEHRYLVSIRINGMHARTGFIASPRVIVSTAKALEHIERFIDEPDTIIDAKIVARDGGFDETTYSVTLYRLYQKGNAISCTSDIADIATMFVEDRDIEFSNGIFESIWTESGLGLDKSADIFGWGSCDVSSSSQAMVSRLRKIKVKILPNSFCDREPIKTSLEFENSKFKMCAKIVNELATAIPTEEDIGTPLVIDNIVVGIYDGHIHHENNQPAILGFTRIRMLVPWVESTVNLLYERNFAKGEHRKLLRVRLEVKELMDKNLLHILN